MLLEEQLWFGIKDFLLTCRYCHRVERMYFSEEFSLIFTRRKGGEVRGDTPFSLTATVKWWAIWHYSNSSALRKYSILALKLPELYLFCNYPVTVSTRHVQPYNSLISVAISLCIPVNVTIFKWTSTLI